MSPLVSVSPHGRPGLIPSSWPWPSTARCLWVETRAGQSLHASSCDSLPFSLIKPKDVWHPGSQDPRWSMTQACAVTSHGFGWPSFCPVHKLLSLLCPCHYFFGNLWMMAITWWSTMWWDSIFWMTAPLPQDGAFTHPWGPPSTVLFSLASIDFFCGGIEVSCGSLMEENQDRNEGMTCWNIRAEY